MRKLATATALALSLALGLALGACGKKAEPSEEAAPSEIVVTDDAAEDAPGEAEAATPTTSSDEAEADVVPVTRAQGPLAVVADDELCSILVTGTGHDGEGYSYGIEATNNSAQGIALEVGGGTVAVAGSDVPAELSCELAPDQTAEAVLTLRYTDALSEAGAFEGAPTTGELRVLDQAGETLATYPLAIN